MGGDGGVCVGTGDAGSGGVEGGNSGLIETVFACITVDLIRARTEPILSCRIEESTALILAWLNGGQAGGEHERLGGEGDCDFQGTILMGGGLGGEDADAQCFGVNGGEGGCAFVVVLGGACLID